MRSFMATWWRVMSFVVSARQAILAPTPGLTTSCWRPSIFKRGQAVMSRGGGGGALLPSCAGLNVRSAAQVSGSAHTVARYGGSKLCARRVEEDPGIECVDLSGASGWSKGLAAGPVGRRQRPMPDDLRVGGL
jgi:hypothetical protein